MMNTSDELKAGILEHARRIRELGGYGCRVRAAALNGVMRDGVLIEVGPCQPAILTDDGTRYRVGDLTNVVVL